MAGKPVGTAFAEISLDSTPLERGLKRVNEQLVSGSIKVEDSYKSLGIKSDAVYEAMRRNATAAVDFIKNKTLSSTEEITRAQEAAAARIKQINEQQFGHQTSLLDTMKKNYLATAAVITAAYYAISRAFDFAEKAAAYAENLETLNFLSSQYNVTGRQMVKTISENSEGLIGIATAAKISADALAKGFTPGQLAQMAKWAPVIDDFSSSVGSSNEAFETLVSSMAAGRERGTVQLLGATIDLKTAFGDQAAQMSKAEKATALYNLVAQRMAEIQKTGVGTTDSLSDAIERYKNQVEELKLTVGDILIRMGAGLMATFQSIAALALGLARVVMAPITALMLATDYLGITKGKAEEYKLAMEAMGDAGVDLAEKAAKNFALMKKGMQSGTELAKGKGGLGFEDAIKGATEASKEIERLNKTIAEDTRKSSAEIAGIGQSVFEKETERIKSQADAWRKAGANKIAIEKWVANETTLARTKQDIEDTKTRKEAVAKVASDAAEMLRVYKETEAERQKAVQAIARTAREELEIYRERDRALEAEANFYEQLTDYTDTYYEKKLALIEKERAANALLYGEKAALAKADLDRAAAAATRWEMENKGIKSMIASTGDLLDSTMSMFKKESGEYKALMALKQVAHIAELGMNVAKMASALSVAMAQNAANTSVATTGAAASVAAQGSVPVAGFALAAAMAAFMASILAASGIAWGGGGATAPAVGSTYSDVTLGASADEQSEAIPKIWDLLQDTYDLESRELTGIHTGVKELNSNIIGLVTGVFRTGGFNAQRFGLDPNASVTRQQFTGGGLSFGATSVQDLLADVQMQIREWYSVGGRVAYRPAEEMLSQQLNLVFESMSNVIVDLTRELGGDITAAMGYVFSAANLDLTGKNADEITAAINDFFATVGSEALDAIFGETLYQFQKLDESLMETAARLVVDLSEVNNILDITGHTLYGTKMEMIAFAESLIDIAGDLETLTNAASTYYDKFFSDEEKQARLQMQLSDVLGDMGMTLPTARQGYRDLVEGLNLSTTSGQEAYATLLKLSEAADDYYSALEDVGGSQEDLTKSLREQSEMIRNWIADLNRSTLAPVQSMEGWRLEYERQKAMAYAPGATTQDVSGYLNYAKEYLSFMRTYGGDYQELYASVVGDAQSLGDMKDTQLAQLDAIAAADTAAREAARIAQEQRNELARLIAGIPPGQTARTMGMGGLTDGLSIAGERGAEWIVPTYEPQRSRFLETVPPQFWENLRGAGVPQGGGGGDITIRSVVMLDGKVIGESVAKQIPRNANLAEAIRRVN